MHALGLGAQPLKHRALGGYWCMPSKRARVLGTTEFAIGRAERELGRELPISFHAWLVANNGLNLEHVHIFPVLDDRDPRKTWDSIVRNFRENWAAWLQNFDGEERDFSSLLPFGEFGTGDFYCFDYSGEGEPAVVLWSHETGETEPRAPNFAEFANGVLGGRIND